MSKEKIEEGKPLSEKKLAKAQADADKINADTAARTASYDRILKDRAAAVGINPDNFTSEQLLAEAVENNEQLQAKEQE